MSEVISVNVANPMSSVNIYHNTKIAKNVFGIDSDSPRSLNESFHLLFNPRDTQLLKPN